jgi:hypothetical protein
MLTHPAAALATGPHGFTTSWRPIVERRASPSRKNTRDAKRSTLPHLRGSDTAATAACSSMRVSGYRLSNDGGIQCGMGKRLAAKTITRWSMKLDRELIALSKTRTLEAIAAKVQRQPESVLKRATKLGLSIKGT